jgi:hypothetical protein
MCIVPRDNTATTPVPDTAAAATALSPQFVDALFCQRAAPDAAPAKALSPAQRQHLAIAALAGTQPIRHLAAEHHVSRKFVYQQADKAQLALDYAFDPDPEDSRILFHLPVTKAWLHQLTLGLVLICHSSVRGTRELLRDLFDYPLSVGTIHAILCRAVPRARAHNDRQDLSRVRIGAHDEIFQAGHPVLVGCDADSTYCYLLSQEEHRDAETWAVRLWESADRGLSPEATVADGGTALRAGQALALPGVPCRGDVFHPFYEQVGPLVRSLEAAAYKAIEARSKLEKQLATPGKRRDQQRLSLAQKLRHARPAEAQAIALADDVALLARWLREDVLAVTGLGYDARRELYDFVLSQLRARQGACPHRLQPVCVALENQRDDLLAFAAGLERDLAAVAAEYQVPVGLVREALQVQVLSPYDVRRGPREAALRQALQGRCHAVSEAVAAVAALVVRASSVVENVNSRLRNYFFLRRQLGPDYLALLQFFLNHRRFLRSERPERVGKSPSELLTGERHGHWLELLGYTRFTQN